MFRFGRFNSFSRRKDFKCRSCGEEFDEDEVDEWLDEDGEDDDDEGEIPCCPYCGSDDVKEY